MDAIIINDTYEYLVFDVIESSDWFETKIGWSILNLQAFISTCEFHVGSGGWPKSEIKHVFFINK